MTRDTIRATAALLVACCILPASAQNSGQCEKMFKEPAEIATCNSVSSLRGGALSDEELHLIVRRTLYGLNAEELAQEAAMREAEQRKAEADREAELVKTDQCYRLFTNPAERESCRTLRMITLQERTDDEMRNAVRERLHNECSKWGQCKIFARRQSHAAGKLH